MNLTSSRNPIEPRTCASPLYAVPASFDTANSDAITDNDRNITVDFKIPRHFRCRTRIPGNRQST